MERPRAGPRQPDTRGWMSRFALFLFILFILTLVSPVVTLLITLLILE